VNELGLTRELNSLLNIAN